MRILKWIWAQVKHKIRVHLNFTVFMKDETWLIYAVGGGWGHLNRALALARIAAGDRAIKILTNSPYLTYIDRELLTPGIFIESISPEIDFIDTCFQIRAVLNLRD